MKAFKHNYRVAMETNKMAVWRLQQEKTSRLFHKVSTWNSPVHWLYSVGRATYIMPFWSMHVRMYVCTHILSLGTCLIK